MYNIHISLFFKLPPMRLVVQGSAIQLHHLMHIHQISKALHGAQFIQIAEHAYYLPNQNEPSAAVKAFCAEQKIDCAYVAENQLLRNNLPAIKVL